MLTKVTRRLSRTTARRAVFTILAALLASAIAVVSLTDSLVVVLALSAIAAALAATVLDVRSDRIMLHDLRWRLGRIDGRVDVLDGRQPQATQLRGRIAELDTELRQMRSLLAVYLYEQSTSARAAANELLPAELVPTTVLGLLDRGDALDAHALAATTKSFTNLSVGTLRRLRSELQRRGYLTKALEVARAIEKLGGEERDLLVRRRIQGDIAVLSGRFTPAVRSEGPSSQSRPGRVLHLVGRSLPQDQVGYTIRTHYTAIAQKQAGLDPHVATQMGFAQDGDTYTVEELDGIAYHRIPGPPRGHDRLDHWLRTHVQRVSNLTRILRPALLHPASDFINAITATIVGAEHGIPVVYEARGFWEESWLSRKVQEYGWDIQRLAEKYGLPDEYIWRRELENQMRLEADRVVTLADVMAQRIEAGGVSRDRIAVIPNAVSVDEFPVLSRNQELATSLGMGEETTVIGYISSLVEYEGIDTLLDAYSLVQKSTPTPVALLIVGDGPVRDTLVRHAKSLGLANAKFTGRVPHDQVLDYYSLIDLFIVPRRPVEVCHLVTPLKPFEAFATGRTVVMSDVRALTAIAEQSGAAELFEAGNPQSLADTLLALLRDPVRQKTLADKGANWVRAERTWSANAQAYLRLYHQMGAKLPKSVQPQRSAMSIDELRSSFAGPKLASAEDAARSPVASEQCAPTKDPVFSAHPFVCGAIGPWRQDNMDRLRRAAPTAVRNVLSSKAAVVWASDGIRRWQSGSQQGLYWSPMAMGTEPGSWTAAAQDRLAAGLVFDGRTALLHTCALGLQELYVREIDGALYFAVRIDPLLIADASRLHPDPVAWASILALGSPLGDATPFTEVRRAVAATGWRAHLNGQDRPARVSFEPMWLGAEPATEPSTDEFIELIARQIPDDESRMAIGLSGGRDSRLLAALARARGAAAPTAWTISTDDGLERDLQLAGPVADALGLDHRLMVPGPEAWLNDRDNVRARLQYQTWYHTWVMPLARILHRQDSIVIDGLAGDALLDGGIFINESVRHRAGSDAKRLALLARLSNDRLGDAGLLTPGVTQRMEQSVRSAFLAATDHFDGHREMLLLSLLATRTARTIGSSPMCLLGPEADVRVPLVHPDVVTAALRVPLERRVAGSFYREVLNAACGPAVASLPTTKDAYSPGRPVARRQASPSALAAMVARINADEEVSALFGPALKRSLADPDECAQMVRSYNGRVTLQWAELLATWRRRYTDRLLWPGEVFS